MRLLWVVMLVACNEVYGLDPTTIRPPQPDRDLDGVFDADDNCRDVSNAVQTDGDGDGFGDACDGCPFATTENHDEDEDGRGDDCDVCPHLPDLLEDTDRDGTGDRCETAYNPPSTTLVAFEGFGVRKPAWYSSTIEWQQATDSIAPVATTSVDDPGLRNDAFAVTTREVTAVLGVTATRGWAAGDRVGIVLIDDAGTPIYGCWLACSAPASCHLEARQAPSAYNEGSMRAPEPIERVQLEIRQGAMLCISVVGQGTYIAQLTLAQPVMRLRPALHGTPGKLIDYLALYEER